MTPINLAQKPALFSSHWAPKVAANSVTTRAGELVIAPKGQVHRPRAEKEVRMRPIEPTGAADTSNSSVTPAAKDGI